MPKLYILLVVFWAAFNAAFSFAAGVEVKDDLHRTVKLSQPAQRIISLAPHNTEILFAVGAGSKVVGVVQYSDYPEAAATIPRIGGYDKINLEKVMTLKPDLIVAWHSGNDARAIQRLEKLGFPVYYSEPRSLMDIAENMTKLATLSGLAQQGKSLEEAFVERLQTLKSKNQNQLPLTIYYEVWQNPRYTLGGSHFTREIFNTCGAVNIFADVSEKAPIVSLEAIITRNPDVILTGDRHGEQTLSQLRNQWNKWPQINAVKQQNIYYVNADIYTRSSPRALDAAEHLCGLLSKVREQNK